MLIHERSIHLTTFLVIVIGLFFVPYAFADVGNDVLAVVQKYGDTEGDLRTQAKLMRPDRVFISEGFRQTDEDKNMAIQLATRQAWETHRGGKLKFITVIEDPVIRIYGNVAVASFVRVFFTFPHNMPPDPPGQSTWVTLVLVKEGGKWGIAHTHKSPVGSK